MVKGKEFVLLFHKGVELKGQEGEGVKGLQTLDPAGWGENQKGYFKGQYCDLQKIKILFLKNCIIKPFK